MEPNIDVLVRLFDQLRMQPKAVPPTGDIQDPALEHPTCSYWQGPKLQNVYICKTCGPNNGICAGCYIHCHSEHEVLDIGPKHSFLCACGTSTSPCSLLPRKRQPLLISNHNFSGRFCLCDLVDNDQTRQSDMHLCVSCTDWFHTDCIQIYNDCHNFAPRKFHQKTLPIIPENTSQYFFLCEACLRQHLYIIKEFFSFVCVNRNEDEMEIDVERYPYHVFVSKEWAKGRSEERVLRELRRLVEDDLKGKIEKWKVREREECEMKGIAEEEEVKMSHEEQIFVAQGVSRIREILEEQLMNQFRLNFRNEIQDLKRKILEIRNRE